MPARWAMVSSQILEFLLGPASSSRSIAISGDPVMSEIAKLNPCEGQPVYFVAS